MATPPMTNDQLAALLYKVLEQNEVLLAATVQNDTKLQYVMKQNSFLADQVDVLADSVDILSNRFEVLGRQGEQIYGLVEGLYDDANETLEEIVLDDGEHEAAEEVQDANVQRSGVEAATQVATEAATEATATEDNKIAPADTPTAIPAHTPETPSQRKTPAREDSPFYRGVGDIEDLPGPVTAVNKALAKLALPADTPRRAWRNHTPGVQTPALLANVAEGRRPQRLAALSVLDPTIKTEEE